MSLAQLPVPGLGVTFAAPWALAAGAAAVAGLVALHAVTVGRPRPAWLPTARFAPDRAPRAARRLRRPADLALLAARALAALCAAAALARPIPTPARRAVARVVVADHSGASDPAAVRAAAGAVSAPGDVLVPFAERPSAPLRLAPDSAARARQLDSALGTPAPGVDTFGTVGTSASDVARRGPASLSAALVAARRAAPALAPGADSIELVLVGALPAEQADAATDAVRAAWGGRARVVRVAAGAVPAAAPGAPPRRAVWLRDAPPDDALAAALALAGVPAGGADAPVRVARARVTVADLAWARGGDRVLVAWPADGAAADRTRSDGAGPPDTAFALVALGGAGAPPAVAVAPFARPALPDTASPAGGPAARVVLRWPDGRPAAIERPTVNRSAGAGAAGANADGAAGCVRTVAVAVPQTGDAALRAGFRALLPAVLGPCGGPRDRTPLAAPDIQKLAGAGPLLAAAPLRARLAPPSPDRLGAALLAAAMLALAAEWPLRRAAARRGAGGLGADLGADLDAAAPDAPAARPDSSRRAAA